MADAITIKALQDASLDAKSLEEVVNGDEVKQVTTRKGETYPSVKKAIKTMFESGGLPATPFETKALMTTSALVNGDYAQVTDDTVNNGLYVKTAGVWVKSSYDPLAQSESSLKSLINTLTKSEYFGKQYVESELVGVSNYAGFFVGVNSTTGADTTIFNTVKLNLVNPSGGSVEYRVFIGSAVQVNATGNNVSPANQNSYIASGVCSGIPVTDDAKSQVVKLDKVVLIPANTPFVIIFKSLSGVKISIGRHLTLSGNLESRGVNFGLNDVAWGAEPLYIGSLPTYTQAGFQLLLQLDSNSDKNSYTPILVMPPKIYTMSGLQAHIYPEHLLPEPEDLYLHDVNCTKGKQVNRGWWWDVPVGEVASTNELTWTLADKQTGETLNSASTSVVVASPSKAGNKNVLVIGDSYVSAGIITQRILDISATDALKVSLIGTRGADLNKHEGRGGWTVTSYTAAGITNYRFTVSGVTTAPAINSATYSYGGSVFKVQETAIVDGNGTIVCELVSGAAPTGSGTLTKTNGSAGDATIAFSAVSALNGNPFWFSGAVNFSQYITTNSLATPDVVLIQLGVNDSFGMTSDAAVEAITAERFGRLDGLIASIKAQNAAVKIGIVSPPTFANQDAFGANYANDSTAWRSKRNIVIWNRELYAYFKNKEAQSIYVVAAGLNVDTQANFMTITQPTNSHNATVIATQSNGVHPAISGYRQIGDAMFAFIKAVA